MLKLSDFNYNLPKELIAQYPLKERDTARLLVLDRKGGKLTHRLFKEITDYLRQDDLLVLNNTKVLPSRLIGKRKTGGKVEILLLKHKEGFIFDTLIKPSRLRLNEEIIFNNGGMIGAVTGRNEIKFFAKNIAEVYGHGQMPLPPYIKRAPEELDKDYYQTIYASCEGAVASPTAGLHFTKELLEKIEVIGVNLAYITLHVGHASFKPVKSENITEHKMENEDFSIPDKVIELLKKAQEKKARIFSVGTTSTRALETLTAGKKEGTTNLFIYPGYKFKMVDCLLTNFHLPRTTLFMLVCAFAGEKLARKAYLEAIDKKYRFYSYGDAMLVI
jgi:S-adenosylmethionine:tRNA ribosyltransferase-isomerase